MIVSPLGEVLAGPLRGEEGVLSAEIDLDEVMRGKFDLDCVGHYSRADSEILHDLVEKLLTRRRSFSTGYERSAGMSVFTKGEYQT